MENQKAWIDWLIAEKLVKPDILTGYVALSDRYMEIVSGGNDPKGEYTKADLKRVQTNYLLQIRRYLFNDDGKLHKDSKGNDILQVLADGEVDHFFRMYPARDVVLDVWQVDRYERYAGIQEDARGQFVPVCTKFKGKQVEATAFLEEKAREIREQRTFDLKHLIDNLENIVDRISETETLDQSRFRKDCT